MAEALGWDGVERRKAQELPVSEGTLGPEYEYTAWDGIERRGKQHEIRLWKIERDVSEIKDKLDDHGTMLQEIGRSFTSLIHVLEALQEWSRIFLSWVAVGKFVMRRDVRLFFGFVILLWYYLKTGDWATVLKAAIGG